MDDEGHSILEISALKKKGIEELEKQLLQFSRPGYWLFSDGMSTNRSPEEQANEIVREKAFMFLNQEIPYELIFEHRGWRRGADALIMEEGLIVQSSSQQRIVSKVKSVIEKAASIDCSELFHRKIRVHISVNVDKKQ